MEILEKFKPGVSKIWLLALAGILWSVVGLVLFLLVLVWAAVQMARLALKERTLTALSPLLLMSYTLITNVTLSYFLEMESWTWVAMRLSGKSPTICPSVLLIVPS